MSISQENQYGGAIEHSISADHDINFREGALQLFDTTTGGLDLNLPDARTMPQSGPDVGYLGNNSTTESLTVKDADGTTIVVLAAGEGGLISLGDRSTAAGEWYIEANAMGVVANPTPNELFYMHGGRPPDNDFDDVREYNHPLDAWTAKTDGGMDSRRTNFVAMGTAGYRVGALNTIGSRDECWQYDPDTWTQKNDLNGDRSNGCTFKVDDIAYYTTGTFYDDVLEEYDDVGDAWTGRTDCPIAFAEGSGAASVNGSDERGYAASGNRLDLPIGQDDSGLVELDGSPSYTWVEKTDAPGPEVSEFSFMGTSSGELYKIGGEVSGSADVDQVVEYDVAGDSWTTKNAFPDSNVFGMGAHRLDDREGDELFTFCGFRDDGVSSSSKDDVEEYLPSIDTFVSKQDAPERRRDVYQSVTSIAP